MTTDPPYDASMADAHGDAHSPTTDTDPLRCAECGAGIRLDMECSDCGGRVEVRAALRAEVDDDMTTAYMVGFEKGKDAALSSPPTLDAAWNAALDAAMEAVKRTASLSVAARGGALLAILSVRSERLP